MEKLKFSDLNEDQKLGVRTRLQKMGSGAPGWVISCPTGYQDMLRKAISSSGPSVLSDDFLNKF